MILIHGVGFTWGVLQSADLRGIPLNFSKNIICVSATSMLTSFIVRGLFLPIRAGDLMPLVAVLIYASVAPFCEALIRITAKQSAAELHIPLLCVIFAQILTASALEALLWSLAALVTYYAFLLLVYSLRKRLDLANPAAYFAGAPVLLVSLAAVVVLLYFCGIAWVTSITAAAGGVTR
jgi:Na+-translocating ferredoxin:NAD+ oxidoreductase RnfA subunit